MEKHTQAEILTALDKASKAGDLAALHEIREEFQYPLSFLQEESRALLQFCDECISSLSKR